jgi:hypothetical protein
MRQNLTGVLAQDQEKFFADIEADVERILRQLKPAAADVIDESDGATLLGGAPQDSIALRSGNEESKTVVGVN